jgi:hypothetical protein
LVCEGTVSLKYLWSRKWISFAGPILKALLVSAKKRSCLRGICLAEIDDFDEKVFGDEDVIGCEVDMGNGVRFEKTQGVGDMSEKMEF